MSDETVKLEGPTGTNGAIGVAGTAEGPTAVTIAEDAVAEAEKKAADKHMLKAAPAPTTEGETQEKSIPADQPTTRVGTNYPL